MIKNRPISSPSLSLNFLGIMAAAFLPLAADAFGQSTNDDNANGSREEKAFSQPIESFTLASAFDESYSNEPNDSFSEENLESDTSFSLHSDEFAARSYGIGGPWRLNSADPNKPGQLSIRTEFNWTTGFDGGGGDDFRTNISINYGIAPWHQLIFEMPIEVGDGGSRGNGDFRLGWHWQLWKESEGWTPSFAIRNYIRVPSGYESSGVDYELRGLFSKSLTDRIRLHFGPYVEFVNGDNIENVRRVQYGASFGSDWRITDKLDLVVDYVYDSSDVRGFRDQHSLDLGVIYEIAPNHKVGVNGRAGLDGDGVNGDWGVGIFYSIAIDGLPSIGR